MQRDPVSKIKQAEMLNSSVAPTDTTSPFSVSAGLRHVIPDLHMEAGLTQAHGLLSVMPGSAGMEHSYIPA